MEGKGSDKMSGNPVYETEAQAGEIGSENLLVPIESWGNGSAPSIPSIDSADQVGSTWHVVPSYLFS